MTTYSQIAITSKSIRSKTTKVVHGFVRDAIFNLAKTKKNSAHALDDDMLGIHWERATDGHFRHRKKRLWSLWHILTKDWFVSQPDFEICADHLKSDELIGPHLDHLVGTQIGTSLIDVNRILIYLMHAMVDDEGRLKFTDERFADKWQELIDFFGADKICCTMIAPLPQLVISNFPLRLNDDLVLDHFTDEEVTRCHQAGVIQPPFGQPSVIDSEVAVGIRKTTYLPKLIRTGEEEYKLPNEGDEGRFGNRPLFREDLVVDDVLSALQLLKQTWIRPLGHVTCTDYPWIAGFMRSVIIPPRWYQGSLELSEPELPQFIDMWRHLEKYAANFGFSIRRFNFSFGRGYLADRIVDLVIAAEALFLGDLDDKYRGELRFRFALRAAKFILHPQYDEHEVFEVMRRAYDARSAIVHGGSPKDTRLPDNPSADLRVFIDAVEELVRLGLHKALLMTDGGKRIRQAVYWDKLMFAQKPA